MPTIRKRGVLQTLLVRPDCTPGHYEIVAGRRRWHAARIVAEERRAAVVAGDVEVKAGERPEADVASADPLDLLPCAILDDGDDADAVEASLIENLARLDADEVTQWETFTRLVREGRSVEEIGLTFGLPDLTVRRVLALGNLLPRIRALYAADKIDRVTIRHLTLASTSQQKAWLALVDDKETRAPTGQQLKAWLFGGQSISVRHALFDVEASGLAVVADLFGEDRWFADPDAFWTAQNAAIEARRAAFLEAGWDAVVVVPPAQHFAAWEHEKAAKRKGGRVYLDVRGSGEVVVHEGYVTRNEAARRARSGGGEHGAAAAKPVRPELSGPLNRYVDLHRHAAVRAALCEQPGVALRLMVAHAIAGSPLWRVEQEPQSAGSDAVAESVETCAGETAFDVRRRAVLALLGFDPERPVVLGGKPEASEDTDIPRDALAAIFARLLDLSDAAVLDVIAVVIGESLAAGSVVVEAVGLHIGMDMADWWQPDPAFFNLIRDREVLTRLVAEVAGDAVASANANEKGKALKAIIRDHLDGTGGREPLTRWVPRWMRFAPAGYTERGGVGSVSAHSRAPVAAPAGPDRAGSAASDTIAAKASPPQEDGPLPAEAGEQLSAPLAA